MMSTDGEKLIHACTEQKHPDDFNDNFLEDIPF